jgi:hypothetical protein
MNDPNHVPSSSAGSGGPTQTEPSLVRFIPPLSPQLLFLIFLVKTYVIQQG